MTMTQAEAIKNLMGDTAWDVPKLRRCLRCDAEFHSEWSGERICRHCKGTSAWRNGY
jgi:hypothetical protein